MMSKKKLSLHTKIDEELNNYYPRFNATNTVATLGYATLIGYLFYYYNWIVKPSNEGQSNSSDSAFKEVTDTGMPMLLGLMLGLFVLSELLPYLMSILGIQGSWLRGDHNTQKDFMIDRITTQYHSLIANDSVNYKHQDNNDNRESIQFNMNDKDNLIERSLLEKKVEKKENDDDKIIDNTSQSDKDSLDKQKNKTADDCYKALKDYGQWWRQLNRSTWGNFLGLSPILRTGSISFVSSIYLNNTIPNILSNDGATYAQVLRHSSAITMEQLWSWPATGPINVCGLAAAVCFMAGKGWQYMPLKDWNDSIKKQAPNNTIGKAIFNPIVNFIFHPSNNHYDHEIAMIKEAQRNFQKGYELLPEEEFDYEKFKQSNAHKLFLDNNNQPTKNPIDDIHHLSVVFYNYANKPSDINENNSIKMD